MLLRQVRQSLYKKKAIDEIDKIATVQHPEDYTLCSAQPRDLLQRQHFLKLFFRTAVVLQAIHKVKSSNMMNLRVFIFFNNP